MMYPLKKFFELKRPELKNDPDSRFLFRENLHMIYFFNFITKNTAFIKVVNPAKNMNAFAAFILLEVPLQLLSAIWQAFTNTNIP